jgi:hypothetical protein
MKNHIYRPKLASTVGIPQVKLDKMLNSDELDQETLQMLDEAIDEILKTWKMGIIMENNPKGMLLRPHVVEKIKKQIAKEKGEANEH